MFLPSNSRGNGLIPLQTRIVQTHDTAMTNGKPSNSYGIANSNQRTGGSGVFRIRNTDPRPLPLILL